MPHINLKKEKEIHLFHQATRIPMCVFDNAPKDFCRYPLIEGMGCSAKTMRQCITALRNSSCAPHVPLLYTSATCFFALMKLDENTNIMFGPVSPIPITYKEFYESNKTLHDLKDLLHLYKIVEQSPLFSLTKFSANLSLFIKLLFQEDITAEQILEKQLTFPGNNVPDNTEPPAEPAYITMQEIMEFQKKIIFNIRTGNRNAIEKMFSGALFFTLPTGISFTTEDMKKIYFMYLTLCYVAALEEGLELQKAFPVFETFLARISSINSTEHLTELCRQVSLDYCNLIIPLHRTGSESPVVAKCLQYIQNKIYDRITVDDLAAHCNLSRRTITRHFTEHYHMPVADYILQLKLKESCFLLAHSHFSLAEISNQLGFSSQSHFTVTFKKHYRYTPQQYRNKFKG